MILNPQPGDFRLVPVYGQFGALIDVGQWLVGDHEVPYKHAAIYLGDNKFLDAHTGGAKINTHTELTPSDSFWSTGIINLSPVQRTLIVNSAKAMEGVPYSEFDYYAMAAHKFHWPVPGLKQYIADSYDPKKRHLICSQTVDVAYLESGIHLFSDNRWPGYVTPASLFWLLVNIQEGIIPNVN